MSTTYRENGSLTILDPVKELERDPHTGYKAQKAEGEHDTYYIREPEDYTEIQSFIAADTVLQDTDIGAPASYFDDDTGLIVTEYLGDTVENAIHLYEQTEPPEDPDINSLIDAVVAKLAVGDNDIAANIMVDTETGEFYPIDFESAGSSLERLTGTYDRENQTYTVDDTSLYTRIRKDIEQVTDKQIDLPDERYTERIQRFMDQIDINQVAERFRENSFLGGYLGKCAILQNLDTMDKV